MGNVIKKRKSQISLFIIIGILILIAAGFLIYLTQKSATLIEPEIPAIAERALTRQEVSEFVESCMRKVAEPLVTAISEQGGTLQALPGREYYSEYYPYLCYRDAAQPSKACINRFITRKSMQDELNSVIKRGGITESLSQCLEPGLAK